MASTKERVRDAIPNKVVCANVLSPAAQSLQDGTRASIQLYLKSYATTNALPDARDDRDVNGMLIL